jgi:hypothetical protein
VAKLPGRNHVFPFDATSAIFVFPHFVAAGRQVDDPFFTLQPKVPEVTHETQKRFATR